MKGRHVQVTLLLGCMGVLGCHEPTEPDHARAPVALSGAAVEGDGNVLTIDHRVPHISTVPANAGEPVHLFLRERVRDGSNGGNPREAVLMIHGRSVPVLAVMALSYRDYDWATWLARSGGFDVFMLDFQGSGRSSHRMMDDPCNVPAAQQSRLIPNPLSAPCPPSYPFTLNTAGSDLDELDTVIEYIRNLRGVHKVHLIGLSAGSFRIGAYGAAHPEKVASLLFYAPIFNAGAFPPPPPIPPTNPPSPLPRPGTPMTVETRADAFGGWDFEAGLTLGSGRCDDPLEPGIKDIVWAAIMENDELGRTWGAPPAGAPAGSPPEGLMRVRQVVQWGWNPEVAATLTLPSAIVWGEFDRGQGGRQDVAELYRLINNENKLRFTVHCGGHFLLWEKPRWILHQISKEWIKHGRVSGFDRGEFVVDTQGNLTPL